MKMFNQSGGDNMFDEDDIEAEDDLAEVLQVLYGGVPLVQNPSLH